MMFQIKENFVPEVLLLFSSPRGKTCIVYNKLRNVYSPVVRKCQVAWKL